MNKIINKFNNIKTDKHFFEIIKGSIWSFGAKILAVIIGLILSVTITRFYGVESMGIFALINSFFTFTLILGLLGLNTAILRIIPEYISKYSFRVAIKIYRKVILLVLFLSIFFSIVIYLNISFISEFVFNNSDIIYMLSLASLFIVIQALGVLNVNFFRSVKAIKLFAFFQIMNPLSKLLVLLSLTIISTYKYNPVYSIFYGYTLVMILSFICIYYIIKKDDSIYSNLNIDTTHSMSYLSLISMSFPMFITASMYVVMSQTDIIMLSMLDNIESVGIYAIVLKLSALTSFVLGTVNTMAAPKFSELYHSGEIEKLKVVAQKSSMLMFWSSVPIVLVFVFLGKFFLQIFGPEFTIAYTALLLLVLGQFINAIVGSVGYFLNMTGYQKELNLIVIFAGIVNIILNYFLIPKFGIEGAALSSAVSLALWNVCAALYIKRVFGFYIGYFPNILRFKELK